MMEEEKRVNKIPLAKVSPFIVFKCANYCAEMY